MRRAIVPLKIQSSEVWRPTWRPPSERVTTPSNTENTQTNCAEIVMEIITSKEETLAFINPIRTKL